MEIRCGFEIAYECVAPCPMLMLLSVRPELEPDLVTPDILTSDPALPIHQYIDGFGNRVSRLVAPPGVITFRSDFVIRNCGLRDPVVPDAIQHPVEDLPEDTLVYLMGSRYCETDRMVEEAWRLFGDTEPGWARVQAIVDYAHKRIKFDYMAARATRTAFEGHEEGVGVCRDYAHLAITLCRCMNIPARYCTGYLGDIHEPPTTALGDFSAWMEVWLGGAWRTFDARHNRPRVGRVLMAIGRDATDVAIGALFGYARLETFTVITEEVAAA